ncbi:MAG: hypothetical protein LBT66_00330 [Methanobrevibacter sp.]|jgi:hypothetical protein|nr:hypothetical protein [Candidatus Methanovirga meridionalis]
MLNKSNKRIIVLIGILSIMSLVYLISAESSSTLNPGDSIQDAIDNSSYGDIIELNDGIYNADGDYDINVNITNLTIKAVDGANPIINASGKNKRVFNIINDNVTLDGLIITGGNTTGPSSYGNQGGGVYISGNNAIISNCNITENIANNGGGVYFGEPNSNVTVTGCNILSNIATYGGGGVSLRNGGVSNSNIISNIANDGGGVSITYGNVIACNITNNKNNGIGGGINIFSGSVSACNINNNIANTGGGVYFNNNGNVTSCNITGNTANRNAGGLYKSSNGNISYNRIFNNNAALNGSNLYIAGSLAYDYNWWGTNNISLAGISHPSTVSDPDSYFVTQLSVNDTWTRTNTTEEFGDNLSLNYRMVLNSTNSSDDVDKLPDFTVTISFTGLFNEVVNATTPWSKNITVHGNYIFRCVCDNEDLHIISHPTYDLSLRNNPQGQVVIGTWIKSTATAIGDSPLPTDYVRFKITSLSDNIVQYDHNVPFGGSNSASYNWQLTKKGTYKVEVWAYDEHGSNVKVPPLGINAMKLSTEYNNPYYNVDYNPHYSVDYIDVS